MFIGSCTPYHVYLFRYAMFSGRWDCVCVCARGCVFQTMFLKSIMKLNFHTNNVFPSSGGRTLPLLCGCVFCMVLCWMWERPVHIIITLPSVNQCLMTVYLCDVRETFIDIYLLEWHLSLYTCNIHRWNLCQLFLVVSLFQSEEYDWYMYMRTQVVILSQQRCIISTDKS